MLREVWLKENQSFRRTLSKRTNIKLELVHSATMYESFYVPYSFLAQQGLLHGDTTTAQKLTNDQVEKKRYGVCPGSRGTR